MNATDLLRLAEALDNLPLGDLDAFDMWVWAEPENPADDCGFAGCAIGWGGRLKVLPDTLICADGFAPEYLLLDEDGGEVLNGFPSVAKAYDIGLDDAFRLFDPDAYGLPVITPGIVANRIRNFIKGHS